MEFYRPNKLLTNFVLVNGTARCGKSLISTIIASFENVEIEGMEGIFDYISISHHFGMMETSSAVSILRTVADEYIYNNYLSRNVNFRWSDHSSVFKNPNKIKYFGRLFRKEGNETVNRILSDLPIFQNQGHDQMQFVQLHLEAWPNTFRMIEIIRNPIDQIDSWWKRGWGTRYGTDPQAFTPCIKFNNKPVPFYAHGWEEEYLLAAPMDRVIKMLYRLQFGNRQAYENLLENDKSQITVIRFEDFVSNTFEHVEQLAQFLNTKTTKYTRQAISKQGCPRLQTFEKRLEKYENIKKEATSPYILLVEEMIEDYKSDWV